MYQDFAVQVDSGSCFFSVRVAVCLFLPINLEKLYLSMLPRTWNMQDLIYFHIKNVFRKNTMHILKSYKICKPSFVVAGLVTRVAFLRIRVLTDQNDQHRFRSFDVYLYYTASHHQEISFFIASHFEILWYIKLRTDPSKPNVQTLFCNVLTLTRSFTSDLTLNGCCQLRRELWGAAIKAVFLTVIT